MCLNDKKVIVVSPLLCHLSCSCVLSQACLGQRYQAVHPLESTKPWSSGTMTSLATLGKVCTPYHCFPFLIGIRAAQYWNK